MSNHVPSQEGENNWPDTRKEAYESANNSATDDVEVDRVKQYENGTNGITRIRLRCRRFSEHEDGRLWSKKREKVYKRYNIYGRLPLSPPESKEITTISENVSIPVPANVNEVKLQGQDDIQPKSNQVITPYIISLIDMLSSPSTLDHLKEAYDSANNVTVDVEAEWVEQYEAGVYINLSALPNGINVLKRVRFRSSIFSEHKAERWWSENFDKVYKRYNICLPNLSSSGEK
ncbi:protein Brevis radix-like 2 [Bidens hawaiensis]|uniref:protein Brevis radix-like 2 n=1 Tax=Bidens hawaiensis TaxID=980011 RepID=UPI004049E37E